MSIEEDRRVEFSKRVHSGDSNSAWPPPPPPPRARKEAAAAVRDDKESDKGEREKRCRHRRSITPPNVRERCKVFVDGGNEAAAQECRRRHRDAPPQRAACRTAPTRPSRASACTHSDGRCRRPQSASAAFRAARCRAAVQTFARTSAARVEKHYSRKSVDPRGGGENPFIISIFKSWWIC